MKFLGGGSTSVEPDTMFTIEPPPLSIMWLMRRRVSATAPKKFVSISEVISSTDCFWNGFWTEIPATLISASTFPSCSIGPRCEVLDVLALGDVAGDCVDPHPVFACELVGERLQRVPVPGRDAEVAPSFASAVATALPILGSPQ